MNDRSRTQTAPAEQRGGTYERDSATTALLWYRTHTIHDLHPRKVSTIGSAPDRDIVIEGEHVSAHHCRIERRSRGQMVIDEGSKNGTYYETKRSLGLGLKPVFEETRASANGFVLVPGMTFVIGAQPHRYVALDDAMRSHHPALLDILGSEDEVRGAREHASPSDLILAADGVGHMLITGDATCEPLELARIVHDVSRRRHKPRVELEHVPDTREAQAAILKHDAAKATLVLNLGDGETDIDPAFVSSLFSSSFQIRVIVSSRTVAEASRALGAQYTNPMMHVGLRPLADRRAAIHRLLDRRFEQLGSPLRVADLTPENQRALQNHEWRENLVELREAALRLAEVVRSEFSLNRARTVLGIKRNTFYSWYGTTMRLTLPLVPPHRQKALAAAREAQKQTASK